MKNFTEQELNFFNSSISEILLIEEKIPNIFSTFLNKILNFFK